MGAGPRGLVTLPGVSSVTRLSDPVYRASRTRHVTLPLNDGP